MTEKLSVERFLDDLASAAPTPGGGSAAAVLGAMGAALLSMVANLTVGKAAYAEVDAEMRVALDRSEVLRHSLQDLVDDDIRAFEAVMAAYQMPRADDAQKSARSAAIQAALKTATEVPLRCASVCAEVIELAPQVARIGNRNALSDAGVAVLAAHAALRSAALNVYINTGSIKDEAFARTALETLERLLERSEHTTESVYAEVVTALK